MFVLVCRNTSLDPSPYCRFVALPRAYSRGYGCPHRFQAVKWCLWSHVFFSSHVPTPPGLWSGVEEEYLADLHVAVSLQLMPAEPAPCRGVVPPMMTSGFVSSLNFGGFEHVKTSFSLVPSRHGTLCLSPPKSHIPAINHQHKTENEQQGAATCIAHMQEAKLGGSDHGM